MIWAPNKRDSDGPREQSPRYAQLKTIAGAEALVSFVPLIIRRGIADE